MDTEVVVWPRWRIALESCPNPTTPSPPLFPPQPFFAERFFALFDSDGSGTITLQELKEALNLLIHGNPMDKLKFLFQVYDVDGKDTLGERGLSGRGQRESAHLCAVPSTGLFSPGKADSSFSLYPMPHLWSVWSLPPLCGEWGRREDSGPGDEMPLIRLTRNQSFPFFFLLCLKKEISLLLFHYNNNNLSPQ